MKNIIIIFIGLITLALLQSCEKMMGGFLDKAPGVDVTEDTIFANKTNVETEIATLYRLGIHSILPRNDGSNTGGSANVTTACGSDEAESANTWTSMNSFNNASITPDNITGNEDSRFSTRYKAIRIANILLARIDKVPELDATYINQVKGEARFVRALNYFEMTKRYGGMPLIKKKFELTDNFLVPRTPLKEVIDFIIAECDTVATLLPDVYPTSYTGRATKGAALMLKAKTLLYAASPLFNTGTPYLNFADPTNNNLICYGNYDVDRWQLAADAAKAVLDYAPTAGIALITNQGVNKNYRYIFEVNDNSEIIFGNKCTGVQYIYTFPWTGMMPYGWYTNTWWMGYSMTVNFMKKYEKKDGTQQTWDPVGGTDLIPKYNELDLRFMQTVCVVGSYWNVNIQLNNAYTNGPYSTGLINCWITKFIPPSMTSSQQAGYPNDILFRLGEAYLDYAEALNEAQGPVADAYTAVNTIRTRSGQPNLPAGLSQAQFRDRVRDERAIELFDEDQRFWDIRRWLIAEQDGVGKGAFHGHQIYQNPAPPDYRYADYVFETRSFNTNMYLYPIQRSEVLKGYLVQNPGW